jgi:hypothetical protein
MTTNCLVFVILRIVYSSICLRCGISCVHENYIPSRMIADSVFGEAECCLPYILATLLETIYSVMIFEFSNKLASINDHEVPCLHCLLVEV